MQQECRSHCVRRGGGATRRLVVALAAGACGGPAPSAAASNRCSPTLPDLPSCYDGQPPGESAACYTVVQQDVPSPTNASETETADVVVCSYQESGNYSMAPRVLVCQNGEWRSGPSNGLNCKAAPQSVWRVTAGSTTTLGWWLYEVTFYKDSQCRTALPGVRSYFDYGPEGNSQPQDVFNAFDGSKSSIWRAPCLSTSSLDICGCKASANEGWSTELKACVPGTRTNSLDEIECIERVAAGLQKQVNFDGVGCPAEAASVGLQLVSPVEVNCVQISPFDSEPYSSSVVRLETWTSNGWKQIREFNALRANSVQMLQVVAGCAPYQLPTTSWMAIEGFNGYASEGEVRTLHCLDDTNSTGQIVCRNERWAALSAIDCEALDVPTFATIIRPQSSGSTSGAAPISPLATVFVAILLVVLVCACACASCFGMKWYLKRQAWERLVKNGCPDPVLEEKVRLTRESALRNPPPAPPTLTAAPPGTRWKFTESLLQAPGPQKQQKPKQPPAQPQQPKQQLWQQQQPQQQRQLLSQSHQQKQHPQKQQLHSQQQPLQKQPPSLPEFPQQQFQQQRQHQQQHNQMPPQPHQRQQPQQQPQHQNASSSLMPSGQGVAARVAPVSWRESAKAATSPATVRSGQRPSPSVSVLGRNAGPAAPGRSMLSPNSKHTDV